MWYKEDENGNPRNEDERVGMICITVLLLLVGFALSASLGQACYFDDDAPDSHYADSINP